MQRKLFSIVMYSTCNPTLLFYNLLFFAYTPSPVSRTLKCAMQTLSDRTVHYSNVSHLSLFLLVFTYLWSVISFLLVIYTIWLVLIGGKLTSALYSRAGKSLMMVVILCSYWSLQIETPSYWLSTQFSFILLVESSPLPGRAGQSPHDGGSPDLNSFLLVVTDLNSFLLVIHTIWLLPIGHLPNLEPSYWWRA